MYANPGLENHRIQTDLEMINGRLMRLYKHTVHEQNLIKNELLVRKYCILPKCHSCKGIMSHYRLGSINHVDTIVKGVIRVTLNSDKLNSSFHRAYFKPSWFFVSFKILRAYLKEWFSHTVQNLKSVILKNSPVLAEVLLFWRDVHTARVGHIFEFQALLAIFKEKRVSLLASMS